MFPKRFYDLSRYAQKTFCFMQNPLAPRHRSERAILKNSPLIENIFCRLELSARNILAIEKRRRISFIKYFIYKGVLLDD